MIDVAYAAGGGGDAGSFLITLMPLILIFVVFYFLLIMPQQKKAKEHKQMLFDLKKGDSVVTAGGIHGTIVGVSDQVFTIDLGEKIKVKVSKDSISYKKKEENKESN
jgi:preprotein translocase subunit YajC